MYYSTTDCMNKRTMTKNTTIDLDTEQFITTVPFIDYAPHPPVYIHNTRTPTPYNTIPPPSYSMVKCSPTTVLQKYKHFRIGYILHFCFFLYSLQNLSVMILDPGYSLPELALFNQ